MALRYSRARWAGRPGRWIDQLWAGARAAGFWLAVALPLAYLPLMASPVVVEPLVLAAALAGNLLALLVGHGHEPSLGRFGAD